MDNLNKGNWTSFNKKEKKIKEEESEEKSHINC